jgi:hypothetical protein
MSKATKKKATPKKVDIPVVDEVPAVCPRCSKTTRSCKEAVVRHLVDGTVSDIIVRHINGTCSVTDRPFNVVAWSPVKCRGCGQHYKVKTRLYQ